MEDRRAVHERLARCFTDYRDERRTEHSVEALVGQRVYGLALGYDELMVWCEDHGVDFVFGLARNPRLQRAVERQMHKSRRRCAATGEPSRRFRDFRYRTLETWSRARRVVGKAEWLPGARGANPRFVVTSLSQERFATRVLYKELYCARGEMENRIKEQQLDLFADRTSTATLRANQLRLYCVSLMHSSRGCVAKATPARQSAAIAAAAPISLPGSTCHGSGCTT